MIHQINIIFHVTAGTIAMVLGAILIVGRKGDCTHRTWGIHYSRLLVVVVGTGFLGWLFLLTVLAGYNTWSGYNVVRRKEARAGRSELLITSSALATGITYMIWLMTSDAVWAPAVIYSTVSALALVTIYDLIKGVFLHRKLTGWWLYEHIYKMISSLSALLSAFAGTVLPSYKPWSQIGPGVLCIMVIVYFIGREAIKRKKTIAI